MIKIDILSATPELLESPFSGSILRRAIEKNIVEVYFHNLRDYSTDKHHKICLLYTSPSPRDTALSRMPSSA